MEQTFQKIVKTYRGERSYREFANALTEKLPGRVSHTTLSRWEADPAARPDLYFFFDVLQSYTDERADFAADCLTAIFKSAFKGTVTINRNKPIERNRTSAAL